MLSWSFQISGWTILAISSLLDPTSFHRAMIGRMKSRSLEDDDDDVEDDDDIDNGDHDSL